MCDIACNYIDKVCREKEIAFLGFDIDVTKRNNHHFRIIQFTLDNGETKNYLVDCTYRQFFTKAFSFRNRTLLSPKGEIVCSIGSYMIMTEKRKKIAEELLTKGYIEATPENIKEYLEAMLFCSQDYAYYKKYKLDFMNPSECIPRHSHEDYLIRLLNSKNAQNGNIDIYAFAHEFLNYIPKDTNVLLVQDIAKRTMGAQIDDKKVVTGLFKKFQNFAKGIFR